MKRILHPLVSVSALLIVLSIVGCASTPKAEKPAEVPPTEAPPIAAEPAAPATKPVDADLTALRDKAEELRLLGVKYGIDTFKKDQWTEAVSAQDAGLAAYGKDYDLSKSSFEDAIARYDATIKAAFAELSAEMDESKMIIN